MDLFYLQNSLAYALFLVHNSGIMQTISESEYVVGAKFRYRDPLWGWMVAKCTRPGYVKPLGLGERQADVSELRRYDPPPPKSLPKPEPAPTRDLTRVQAREYLPGEEFLYRHPMRGWIKVRCTKPGWVQGAKMRPFRAKHTELRWAKQSPPPPAPKPRPEPKLAHLVNRDMRIGGIYLHNHPELGWSLVEVVSKRDMDYSGPKRDYSESNRMVRYKAQVLDHRYMVIHQAVAFRACCNPPYLAEGRKCWYLLPRGWAAARIVHRWRKRFWLSISGYGVIEGDRRRLSKW